MGEARFSREAVAAALVLAGALDLEWGDEGEDPREAKRAHLDGVLGGTRGGPIVLSNRHGDDAPWTTAVVTPDGSVCLDILRPGAQSPEDTDQIWIPAGPLEGAGARERWGHNRAEPNEDDRAGLSRMDLALHLLAAMNPNAEVAAAWLEHELENPGTLSPLEWLDARTAA